MESILVALAAGGASAAVFWWLGRRLGWGDDVGDWLDPAMPRDDGARDEAGAARSGDGTGQADQ